MIWLQQLGQLRLMRSLQQGLMVGLQTNELSFVCMSAFWRCHICPASYGRQSGMCVAQASF
jgi:hypothetical protein